ncbi:protein O-mannosyl-transferase TMTC4-like [Liolophura sinensis]|uniref:protein O-mannosyl-transferase TMTC4-like n=1 Tax=Liolophura sinensis TaxID=3198878 RepID=UPI003158A064
MQRYVAGNNNSKKSTDKNQNRERLKTPGNGHGAGNVSSNDGSISYRDQGSFRSWDDYIPVPKLGFMSAAACIAVIAVLCFANSVSGEFVFDDNEAILNNKDLLPETPLSLLFSHDFWGRTLNSSTSHKSYRPLTVMTFRLNYFLAGGLHPWGFHLTNILLHSVVSLLFLAVFSVLIGGYSQTPGGSLTFKAPRSSLFCAVLFAAHPIHVESVAGVVGRADLLCAFLFAASFLSYVKACHSGTSSVRPESCSPCWLLLSMLLCSLSVLCKEQGITVIGLCSAYDIIQVCRINIFTVFTRKQQASNKMTPNNNNNIVNPSDSQKAYPPWLKSLIFRHCILLFTGVILLVVRWRVMGSAPPTFQLMDNPHSFVNGTLMRTVNYHYLYAMNGWLLVNPWWLCFDWSMGCIPVITSLADPRILAAIAFWAFMGLIIYSCWKEEVSHHERVLLLGLAFLVIPFLPATNLLFRVGFVIAERVLYLSTAGFCLLIATGVQRMAKHFPASIPVLRLVLPVLVVIMISRCIQRSAEWRNELVLFTAGARVCPLNAKVHYNIGKVVSDRGDEEYAIQKYREAIELYPEYDQAMNNLGNILKDRGDNQEAESILTRAVKIRPDFAAAWMNLGIVQASLNKFTEAEKSYFTAISHRRKYPDCYYNLGNLYLSMERHTDALIAWRNATLQRPTHLNAWNNMLILLANQKRWREAETVGKEALRFLPDASSVHLNMANNYGKDKKYESSEKHFLQALKLDGNNPSILTNLGVLYHWWDKPAKAEKMYLRAIELNPGKTGPGSPRNNLEMLYKQKGRGPY